MGKNIIYIVNIFCIFLVINNKISAGGMFNDLKSRGHFAVF